MTRPCEGSLTLELLVDDESPGGDERTVAASRNSAAWQPDGDALHRWSLSALLDAGASDRIRAPSAASVNDQSPSSVTPVREQSRFSVSSVDEPTPRQVRVQASVAFLSPADMRALNHQYRGRDQATNVLSFPADMPTLRASDEIRELEQDADADVDADTGPSQRQLFLLGDMVFCPEVIAREAAGQGKRLSDHWAHLTVHAMLHLLGHEHTVDVQAEAMEALEIRILSAQGIPDPYRPAVMRPDE